MGIQHEGAHARVFHGIKGDTKVVPLRKRDVDYNDNLHRFIHRPEHNTNHGGIKMNVPTDFKQKAQVDDHNTNHGNIKLNVPEGFAQKQQVDADVETVYSVVYQTMSQTFEGTPAGFVTETGAAATPTNIVQPAAQTTSAAPHNTQNADEAAYESRKAAAQGNNQSSSSSVAISSSATPTAARDPAAQHAAMTASPATSASSIEATPTSVMVGNAGLDSADSPSVVHGSPIAATRSPVASTQDNSMSGGAKAGIAFGVILGLGMLAGLIFFCMRRKKNKAASNEAPINEKETYNEKSGAGFGAQQVNRFSSDSDKRSSTQTSATAPRLSLRPVTQFLPNLTSNNQSPNNNALGSLANTPMTDKSTSAWERRSPSAQNPFHDAAVLSEKQANPFDEGDGSAHDRNNSIHSQSSTASASEPPTPGKVATAAAVPVQRDVHRVQLDFKPSMEDELELISGQLVRMLHEYDDGWALCIRMDRTQQGVVPRTCLSKLPVKPRGPPRNNGPHSSQNSRSGPPPPQGAMAPRPLTPSREQSPAKQAPAEGAQGQAGVARKPVPGMAM